MITTVIAPSSASLRNADVDQRDLAAARLYDAEVALHAANQSHVEAWITAAASKLHAAIEAHMTAAALADAA